MTEQQPATTDDEPGQHRAPDQGLLERINLSEPVRLRLWSITAAVVALLAGYGLLATDKAGLWLGVAAAALATGVGTTSAVRAAVVSPTTARRTAVDAVEAAAQTPMHPFMAARLALHWNGIPHR